MRYLLICSIIFAIGSLIENVACISEDDEELIEKINSESDKILKKMKTNKREFLDNITNESERGKKERQFSEEIQTFEDNVATIQDEINLSENED